MSLRTNAALTRFEIFVGIISVLGVVFSAAYTVYTHRPKDDLEQKNLDLQKKVLQLESSLVERLKRKNLEAEEAKRQANKLRKRLDRFKEERQCEISTDNDPVTLEFNDPKWESVGEKDEDLFIVSVIKGPVLMRQKGDKPEELKKLNGKSFRERLTEGQCYQFDGPIELRRAGKRKNRSVVVWQIR